MTAAPSSVRVSRIVRAGTRTLFQAWTDPRLLRQWWRQEGDGWSFAGASVDLRGMTIGEVTAVKMKAARSGRAILAAVEINLYPDRIEWQGASPLTRDTPAGRRRLIDSLVGSGLRAQLRPASLLSGDVYVAIDFFPA